LLSRRSANAPEGNFRCERKHQADRLIAIDLAWRIYVATRSYPGR